MPHQGADIARETCCRSPAAVNAHPLNDSLGRVWTGTLCQSRRCASMGKYGTHKGPCMDDVISKLTPAQALKIVERLGRKGGKIREAVLTEAMNVLTEIDVDETADEVVAALESIDVQDCWDRSGNSRDGYTSPDEAAAEIIEEELQPFFDQVERYHEMGRSKKRLIAWESSSEFTAMSGSPSRSSENGLRTFQPNVVTSCWTSGENEIEKRPATMRCTSLSARIVQSGPNG